MDRRVTILNVVTQSERLRRHFRDIIGPKPNFDSTLKFLGSNGTENVANFNAKSLPSWSTIDVGWTFSPFSVMSVGGGRMAGIEVDTMRVVAEKLGIGLKYHYANTFDETNKV